MTFDLWCETPFEHSSSFNTIPTNYTYKFSLIFKTVFILTLKKTAGEKNNEGFTESDFGNNCSNKFQ